MVPPPASSTGAPSPRPEDSAHPSAETPLASSYEMGPHAPRTRGRLLRAVGRTMLAAMGWRFDGALPDVPKFVVIVAPHTSNWDFPVGLFAKWAMGFDTHFWGKDTLFRPPLGWFMRANGGIPVDRTNRSQMVANTIALFATHERFALTLSPEGTRKKVTRWRTGFWHVAKGANVPIACIALDWSRKVIRLGPTTMPVEDDMEAGIARLQGYFVGAHGYHRELE